MKSKMILMEIVGVLILIVISGCHNKMYYKQDIETYLNTKYNQTFIVESIGGVYGTHDDSTLKAWCYATDGDYKDIKFMAEIDKKDSKSVKDQYLNIIAADMFSQKVKESYDDDCKVVSVIETSQYLQGDKIESLDNYLDALEGEYIISYMFVENQPIQDCQDTVEKLAQTFDEDIQVIVYFVDKINKQDIQNTFKKTTIDKMYDTYKDKSYVKDFIIFQIRDGQLVTR